MFIRDAQGDTGLALSRKTGQPLKSLTNLETEILDFTEATKDELAAQSGKDHILMAV